MNGVATFTKFFFPLAGVDVPHQKGDSLVSFDSEGTTEYSLFDECKVNSQMLLFG